MTMAHQPPPPNDDMEFQELARSVEPRTPSNVEAEQALLGSLLLDEKSYFMIDSQAQEFYLEKHRWIFEASQQLASAGTPIDFITLTSRLEENKKLERCGGAAYLTSLLNAVPTAAHIVHYAELVRDASIRRDLLRVSTEIAQLALNPSRVDSHELMAQAFSKLYLLPQHSQGRSQSFGELMQLFVPQLQQYRLNQQEVYGIETGFDMDQYIGGLQRQEMMLSCGYPGKGKTSKATQIAFRVAKKGRAVLVFSLEMASLALMLRMSAQNTKVNTDLTRQGKATAAQYDLLQEWAVVHADIPLFINESTQTLASIQLETARLKAMGIPLELLIVDYSRLVEDRTENEALRTVRIMRGLKQLGKSEDLAMLVMHPLNRDTARRGKDEDGRAVPTLGNLAYGGEYEADVVEVVDFDDVRTDYTAYDYILKNRNGRIGRIKQTYNETLTLWGNYTEDENAPHGNGDGRGNGQQMEVPAPWEQAALA